MRPHLHFLLSSAALFLGSLFLPALSYDPGGGGSDSLSGLNLLLLGWFDVFEGVVGWLANPLYAFGCVAVLLRRRYTALVLLGLAVLLAISSVQLFSIGVMRDESGHRYPLAALSLGFFAWLAAIVTALLGAAVKDAPVTT